MTQTLIERDIKATVRLLRYLTKGEGFAGVSVFDAGAGGGFSHGSLTIYLERSGMTLKDKKAYDPEEMLQLIKSALWPFDDEMSIEEINEYYKKSAWDG